MNAFKELFVAAKYPIIAKIDDDVIRISRGIAEEAVKLFAKYPRVQQIVADVYQDQWTTGSRPPMETYTCYSRRDGLYNGLIDGWFSIYRNTPLMIETLMEIPYKKYEFVGSWARHLLINKGYRGLLCTKFKVLHLSGPYYAHFFGRLGFEIDKYRAVGRNDIVEAYTNAEKTMPSIEILERAKLQAFSVIDSWSVDHSWSVDQILHP